ncbi:MAG: IclR family transcriptional regulator [Propionicimonas sp.]|uniref:IclR family transcriptional regulator n=1 Tax=Propionicimonas sp. TaxID=1955623 RepID=UPI002B21ADBB|nr:IclR family transcriptional regulator [Propionicimonas sp.]MEA4944169.1 IclR family transcriptional regulator [Propionicimonas sp.]MEA5053307.1 IclR family transcriptional regulator [Propionicimonas sp.]MEA5119583.1 IclR family transcriptional regulator [Propionicimonas sp.]
MEAVDRALLVLQALADASVDGVTLADLAARLGLHKTTLHRTLAALRYRGFVSQDPVSSRYLLGVAATLLGATYFGEENLPRLLRPALTAVCARAGELVHLGVLAGTEVVYLDKVEPERAVRVWSAVGRRMPAGTTALGRAILAFSDVDASLLPRYLGRPEGAGDPAVLQQAVATARSRGYATESEENEPGIACVAVPLLRGDDPIAAVSVTVPVERMGRTRAAELAWLLFEVAGARLPDGLRFPSALPFDQPR